MADLVGRFDLTKPKIERGIFTSSLVFTVCTILTGGLVYHGTGSASLGFAAVMAVGAIAALTIVCVDTLLWWLKAPE